MTDSREIADTYGWTVQQVRRWSVLVLGVDPMTGKGKGVKREYSHEDAMKIISCGKLVDRGWTFRAITDYLSGVVLSIVPPPPQTLAPLT